MNKNPIIVLLFFAVLSASFAGCFVRKNETVQYHDDLDALLTAKYGRDYIIIVNLPKPLRDGNKFRLYENDLIFPPNSRIEGKLEIRDGDFGFQLNFSYETDPDNYTVVCGVKYQTPGESGGWCKVVLKMPDLNLKSMSRHSFIAPVPTEPDSDPIPGEN